MRLHPGLSWRDRLACVMCALEYTLLCPTDGISQRGGGGSGEEIQFVEPGCQSKVEKGVEHL